MDLLASGTDPVVWLGGAAILSVVAVTFAFVALRRRLDRLGEDLKGLRKLATSLPAIDTTQAQFTEVPALASTALPPGVSELKLHLSQIKRQQLILLDRITRISSTLSDLHAVPNALEDIREEQARVLEALATVSAELEDWIARFDDTSSELTHLLESEPVVEFQNSLDPK
jgi:uncharacterized phage infection (PIP) family protein YhgE